MLHSTCKFPALFSESPVPACRSVTIKINDLVMDLQLHLWSLSPFPRRLMSHDVLFTVYFAETKVPAPLISSRSCELSDNQDMKGKGQEHKMRKRHEKENLTETNLLTLVPPIKISERLHELQWCLFATCRFGRTYISKNQLVPACPVPGSFSRIELRALGPQRSDQNHHFCDIPENIWSSLDPANAVKEITIQGVYSMGIHLSCSLAQVRQNAMIQLPRGFVSGCTRTRTKHGTRTSRFVQLCSCGSKKNDVLEALTYHNDRLFDLISAARRNS